MLGLVCTLTYSFSAIDCLLLLYYTLITPKLEYASTVWNNILITDAKKLNCIQQEFAAPCFCHLFPITPYNYTSAIELLNLHILHLIRYHFDSIFFIHAFQVQKFVLP